jgi:hypothetical protein
MFEMDLIQINRPPAPPNEGVSAAGKATEPDDVLIERAAHRNHQREG